jgi:cell fate (sporulation/competence/biofilm development) regulator YlbF (YheA/YmcA/DUF963 family)
MQELLDHARRLAEMIAAHERTKAFREAAAAVEADPAARKVQEGYANALEEIHRLESAGRPIEPEQKRRAAQAADEVRKSPILLRMLRAHAEYMEMLDAVQHVLAGGEVEAHEHGPGCDHGDEHGHAHAAEPEAEEPPAGGKPGGILWTP